MDIDLEQVSAFLRVVETGSFTRAAELLGVSKSSVSRRIAQLEERLGARLLSRTTRKIALTEVGDLYYQKASEALNALDEAGRSVSSLQDEARGHLKITAPADFHTVLASMIPAFTSRYPGISVEVIFSQRILDLVGEGIDIALRAGALQDSSLIARKLSGSQRRLYATPGYLHANGTPAEPSDLESHAFILFRGQGSKERLSLYKGEEKAEVEVTGRISGDGFDFIRQVVLSGLGIGALPSMIAEPVVERGELERVLPEWEGDNTGLYLVYPAGRFVSAKVQVFRDFCVQWFGEPFEL
jgi:DNA-binding transcriptional LysR family regulator